MVDLDQYVAFNLAISFQSPLRLALQPAFANKDANFVEEDLKILIRLLGLVGFLGSHTGEQVAKKLRETTATFAIENHKVGAV